MSVLHEVVHAVVYRCDRCGTLAYAENGEPPLDCGKCWMSPRWKKGAWAQDWPDAQSAQSRSDHE